MNSRINKRYKYNTYCCVLGALAEGRRKGILGRAEHGGAVVEGSSADVQVPDAKAPVRVAEAHI